MNTKIDKDDLYKILERNDLWINNCDTKASIILGFIGVILGILFASDYITKISEIYKYMIDNIRFLTILYIIITSLSICTVVVGVLFLLFVLVPKTNAEIFKEKEVTGNSLIFFSSITKNKSFQEYESKIKICSEGDLLNDITSQIYICSLICDKKFQNYKRGLFLSILGFAIFAIMIVIGILVI
jgi:hypothetical protein